MGKEDIQMMTPLQVAHLLEVHVGTLANWRYYGEGPRYIRKGRRILYVPDSVKRFKETRA